ncbi:MAG: glycoside hydrolase family 97 catalytic domain-containing protein [Prevotella sp.]|nr:glycoside hydrolase family 97 catalytic domain-containing protein [Candidatus Prevotella equi]
MKKQFCLATLAVALSVNAQTLSSPDGQLSVTVGCDNGIANYMVVLGNDTVVRKSPLGIKTNMGDFSKGMKLTGSTQPQSVSESYTLPNAKKQNISYTANEATWMFNNEKDKPAFSVTFHVDNNNVAFKYDVKAQGDRRSCIVTEESTFYTFAQDTKTFLCPQMTPQTGFARTAPSYETFYEYDAEMGKDGWGRGYTFPALFKVTSNTLSNKKGQGESYIWVMLSETNIGGNYCASRIVSADTQSYRIAYPEQSEFGGVGSTAPGLMLAGANGEIPHAETPWRTITVGRTLAPIAETTIQWDLVKPQYEASKEYKYGRSAWSWIIRMDASCNYDEQKEYVDFAAAMGWEYLLVDAFWDSNIGYDRIEQLSKYAQSKGVGLFLWYNSNGYWNDAPQGPRGKMHRMIDRRKEMAWMQKAGIKGIKVDFVGSDKQQTMQMYEDILADANDYGIMVIYHGCTLQRGWERMYPNFVSCEAVRASENLSFGQHDNDIEALAATIHPVLRNAVGNMDFGGSALNKHYSKDNKRGKTRVTSDVYALATAILFQTPVQNFALAPNNLDDAPAWAIDFMKAVPVTWKDMKFIDGYPGQYVALERMTGSKHYVAAVNAADNAYVKEINVPANVKEVTLYSDDANLNGSVKQVKVKKGKVKVTVPKNGGAVIVY